ncbi:hypothetical protein FA13DRAFT_1728122 [Coprinellus micaceus]|uniref:Nephrocystin 3-like N-terminal domain-containing protein n=1 Tax=Coprinellus micaceus TaxID=71717 RepID=A0A4Y7TMB3_COPMI|nr:hypothetical protein FA13DRAFT_1728122 [Coprinellus micaceus]
MADSTAPTYGAVAELLDPIHRQGSDNGVNEIHNYYYGPVHHIGTVANAAIGPNHGTITQNVHTATQPVAGPSAQPGLAGVTFLLNPIHDAAAPPDSACLPGTRKRVLKQIQSWVDGSLLFRKPHIMWSAIAQAIADDFAQKGRLAASFFFFRQAGDRNNVSSQVAAAIPGAAHIIESAVRANPGLATPACSLAAQFQQLIYNPIKGSKWVKMGAALRNGGYLIVLDGLDECNDREEVAALIQHMLEFFQKEPRFPLKFLITSRVEQHIHQQLRSSIQVQLLNLVDHTSDADISAALDARVEMAKRTRVLSCEARFLRSMSSMSSSCSQICTPSCRSQMMTTPLSPSGTLPSTIFSPRKGRSGSFFANPTHHNHLASACIPLVLHPFLVSAEPVILHCRESLLTPRTAGCINGVPDDVLDSLYKAILTSVQSTPHFLEVTRIIALARGGICVAEIAELSGITILDTLVILRSLQGIVQVPASDMTPVTLWHASIRNFLRSEARSGPFFTSAMHHQQLANRLYHGKKFVHRFLFQSGIELPPDEVDGSFAHLRSICPALHDVVMATYINIEHDFFDTTSAGDRQFCSTLGTILHHLLPNKIGLVAIGANREFDRPLLAHSKRLFPQLTDPSHHINMVMCGVALLVRLKDSDDALVLHSRSDYPTGVACEYMFACWARHLALAIEGNPQHPAFNTTQPTRIPIAIRLTVVNHYELPVSLVERVGLNLGFAEKTVRDLVGPEALSPGNEWKWDIGYGPRAYIKNGAKSVTVFEVLNGLRGLFSCYRSACSHVMTRKCPFLP